MMLLNRFHILICLLALLVCGCGGVELGGDSGNSGSEERASDTTDAATTDTHTYTIGGTISGLSGIVILQNGNETLGTRNLFFLAFLSITAIELNAIPILLEVSLTSA